ncbi:MAG TPA: LysR family transcriptional regulator [Acidobacteriota bacterium]
MIRPRFRILYGSKIAIGPGKADLLKAIHKNGSIGEAAKSLGMSYMRAWEMLQTMNQCFDKPLVSALRGGHKKGGTKLTTAGILVLKMYEELENKSLLATYPIWKKIVKLLR